jgi:hypothetical protein
MARVCEHGNEPSGSMKKEGYSLKTRVTIAFSKKILHHGVSYNEELHNLYASPNIIRLITSRRMRWTGHEKCI